MAWGITSPAEVFGVHWLRETGIACAAGKGETTFALGAVTCRACRVVMDLEIESLMARVTTDVGPFSDA